MGNPLADHEANKMATIVATFRQGGKWPIVKTVTIVAIRWTVQGTTVLTSRSGNEGYNCTHRKGRSRTRLGLCGAPGCELATSSQNGRTVERSAKQ